MTILSKTTNINKMNLGLTKAIKQYNFECNKALITSNYSESGPFIIAEDIPLLAFESWSLLQDNHWRICYDKKIKTVLLSIKNS